MHVRINLQPRKNHTHLGNILLHPNALSPIRALPESWYTPGLFGGSKKKASKVVTQFNVFSFNKDGTKFTGYETFYDSPAVWDELTGTVTWFLMGGR